MNWKNIDLKLSIGISALGVLLTIYLWFFVDGGNHWALYGTEVDRILGQYGLILVCFFSLILTVPMLIKINKIRIITAVFSIPVLMLLYYSLMIFSD